MLTSESAYTPWTTRLGSSPCRVPSSRIASHVCGNRPGGGGSKLGEVDHALSARGRWPRVVLIFGTVGISTRPWSTNDVDLYRRVKYCNVGIITGGTCVMTEPAVERFEINVPQDALDDLDDRLRRTRFADDFGNDDWTFGVPGDYLRAIVEHWRERFDWRAQEAAMNRFDHYRVDIDGIPIHFVHERGRGPAPMPLILTHGWPWTFWDYEHLIAPLADPAAFGGDPATPSM